MAKSLRQVAKEAVAAEAAAKAAEAAAAAAQAEAEGLQEFDPDTYRLKEEAN